MNTYVKVDYQGYVTQVIVATIEQPDSILIDFDMGQAPNKYCKYLLADRIWVDPRSEQQKKDDAAQPIIEQRNVLLYESDWTQIPNNPLTQEQQTAWAVYRQELRDISQQEGYPYNVVWPTPPQ